MYINVFVDAWLSTSMIFYPTVVIQRYITYLFRGKHEAIYTPKSKLIANQLCIGNSGFIPMVRLGS